jgi:hypothetical protein
MCRAVEVTHAPGVNFENTLLKFENTKSPHKERSEDLFFKQWAAAFAYKKKTKAKTKTNKELIWLSSELESTASVASADLCKFLIFKIVFFKWKCSSMHLWQFCFMVASIYVSEDSNALHTHLLIRKSSYM